MGTVQLLPETPRLAMNGANAQSEIAEVPQPTPQARELAKDGGPLESLSTCRWCGGMHPTACPYIKVAEWHENGQLSRIVLEERAAQKTAILYPFEEEDAQTFARELKAIAEASTLKQAREIATALLKIIQGEAPDVGV